MKKFYKTLGCLLMALIMGSMATPSFAQDSQQEALFGSNDMSEETLKQSYLFGLQSTGTFAMAYQIPATLAGSKIVGVYVPFRDTRVIRNFSAWVASDLEGNVSEAIVNGKTEYTFTPDLASKDFEASTSETFIMKEVRFDNPVIVPEGGCFIGYSLTVRSASTTYGKYPFIALANPAYMPDKPLMLFSSAGVKLSATEVSPWIDGSNQSNGKFASAIVAILADIKAGADLQIQNPEEKIILSPDRKSTSFKFTNMSGKPVRNFEIEKNFDGVTTTSVVNVPETSPLYTQSMIGATGTVDIVFDNLPVPGTYPLSIKVTKVNGEANASADRAMNTSVLVANRWPEKRPVLEELTSTQCGYCPRGFYGLEVLKRYYPSAIALSFHSPGMGSDPMIAMTTFPISGGLPTAIVDRKYDTTSTFDRMSAGFIPTWETARKDFGYADMQIKADWADDSKEEIVCTATANFAVTTNERYRIDFAVIQDGMHGTPKQGYSQSNYYSGKTDEFSEPEWDVFGTGKSKVTGLVYDDVVIASAGRGLSGLTGSLPGEIECDKDYEYSHTFTLSKMHNYDFDAGKYKEESIVQDKEKLRVVAVLIDVASRTIVNAAQCNVPGTTGITAVEDGNNDIPVAYYDLMGRQVKNPAPGIYIVRYANGKAEKRIIR